MSIDAKTANLLAQAERAEQRALDAAEQRELKIKQWEVHSEIRGYLASLIPVRMPAACAL